MKVTLFCYFYVPLWNKSSTNFYDGGNYVQISLMKPAMTDSKLSCYFSWTHLSNGTCCDFVTDDCHCALLCGEFRRQECNHTRWDLQLVHMLFTLLLDNTTATLRLNKTKRIRCLTQPFCKTQNGKFLVSKVQCGATRER